MGYMWTKYTCNIGTRVLGMSRQRVEARWAARHERGGQAVYNMVNSVRGYYVKSGQVLATKREFVPAAWCVRLAKLWDDTPPRPWRNVRRSILSDLHTASITPDLEAHTLAAQGEASTSRPPLADGASTAASVSTVDDGTSTFTTLVSPRSPRYPPLAATPPPSPAGCSQSPVSGWWGPRPRSLLSPLGFAASSTWGLRPRDTEGAASPTASLLAAHGGASPAAIAHRTLGDAHTADALTDPESTRGKRRGGKRMRGRKAHDHPRHKDPLHRFFTDIDPTPLASASIAQVHTARLSPDVLRVLGPSWPHGPDVVVKVQHHDVQRLMGADLRNMGRIARFLNHVLPFDVAPAVTEMQRVIPKEFDFEREARLMAALRARLMTVTKRVVVPEPVLPLCGPGIIVMQRMPGTPLTALLAAADKGDTSAREACRRCLEPVLEAYGHMMLVQGLFHADPHPGNMLLQDDGRVVLLDYGQCKALTDPERRALAALYVGLARGNTVLALGAVRRFGLVLGPAPSHTVPDGRDEGVAGSSGSGSRHANVGASGLARTASGRLEQLRGLSIGGWAGGSVSWAPGGWLGRLFPALASHTQASALAARELKGLEDVDLDAARRMLNILFDTRYSAEGAYNFTGGDVVEGAPVSAFPGPLYLVCRAILILRGICASIGAHDVSVVQRWAKIAAAGLRERADVAEARAAENAALDVGHAPTV